VIPGKGNERSKCEGAKQDKDETERVGDRRFGEPRSVELSGPLRRTRDLAGDVDVEERPVCRQVGSGLQVRPDFAQHCLAV